MSYTAPVQKEKIRKAEKKFRTFLVLYWLIMGSAFLLAWRLTAILDGNMFWTIGSSLVLFSVMHSRYFDIKKNANPDNNRFDSANGSGVNPVYRYLEKVTNNAWLIGFVFLALSRFLKI